MAYSVFVESAINFFSNFFKQKNIEKQQSKLDLKNSLLTLNQISLEKGNLLILKNDIMTFSYRFSCLNMKLYECYLDLMPILSTYGCMNNTIKTIKDKFHIMSELHPLLYKFDCEDKHKMAIINSLIDLLFEVNNTLIYETSLQYNKICCR